MSKEEESKQAGESTKGVIAVRRTEHATSMPSRGELLSRPGWRFQIGGLVVGVIIVLLPWLVPGLNLGLGISIVLGLLAALLGQALQLDARAQDLDTRTQAAIQDLDTSAQAAVDRAGEQADLWRKLEQAPWMSELMKGIIDDAASIDATPDNDIFVARTAEMMEEWRDGIREMAEGQIRVGPAQFSSVVMPLVEKALAEMGEGGTLMAVSVWTTRTTNSKPPWWYSPAGTEYWEANYRALTRDKPVSIKRIFVYQPDSSGGMPRQLDDLIKQQCINEHIHIYTVEASKIEAFLQLDMAVFDKQFEYEQRVSHVGEIQEYLCSTSRLDISRRVRQFESIMAKSETSKDKCKPVLAQKEFNAGHVALAEGNWQEAQQRYEKAGEFGYEPKEYITVNLAMVGVGKGKYSDARRHLEEHYHPRAGTAPYLHKMALTMMCEIAEEGAGAALKERLEELEEEKKSLTQPYNYYIATNPLIRLENGLSKTPPESGMPDIVPAVFETLKTPTSKKSSSTTPPPKTSTSHEPSSKEPSSKEPSSTKPTSTEP